MELNNSYKFNRISGPLTYALALGVATLVGCEQTPVLVILLDGIDLHDVGMRELRQRLRFVAPKLRYLKSDLSAQLGLPSQVHAGHSAHT